LPTRPASSRSARPPAGFMPHHRSRNRRIVICVAPIGGFSEHAELVSGRCGTKGRPEREWTHPSALALARGAKSRPPSPIMSLGGRCWGCSGSLPRQMNSIHPQVAMVAIFGAVPMQLLRGVNVATGDPRRVAGGSELSFSLQKGGVSAVATTYSRSPVAQRYAPSRSGKADCPVQRPLWSR
jgi:hypothetical protein